MKTGIHPENYRLCVFKDMGTGDQFITKSCADAKDTIEVDGVEYPLIKMEISSYSHPFYTVPYLLNPKMIRATPKSGKRYLRFLR